MSSDDSELVFRALVVGGRRRGVRLEKIFWVSLARAAQERGVTVASQIGEAADSPDETNLASALRVKVARWLTDNASAGGEQPPASHLAQIVHACPSAAALLAGDGRLRECNERFRKLLESATGDSVLPQGITLTFDDGAGTGSSHAVAARIVANGATLVRLDVRLVRPDGSGSLIAFALEG